MAHHACRTPEVWQKMSFYAGDPHLSHYAWYAEVSNMSRQWEGKSWQWNKHDYKDFEVELCPRWNAKQGLFPDPPLPSELTTKVYGSSSTDLYDMLPHVDGRLILIHAPQARSSMRRHMGAAPV